jgi:hypothetical protein
MVLQMKSLNKLHKNLETRYLNPINNKSEFKKVTEMNLIFGYDFMIIQAFFWKNYKNSSPLSFSLRNILIHASKSFA